MSAGTFETGKYEDNAGNIWECRVQPETKGLSLDSVTNAYPTDAATADLPTLPVKVSGRRGFGITMRSVTIEITGAPAGAQADYEGVGTRFTIPVFDPAVWQDYAKDEVGTYNGMACKYVLKSPEFVR